MKQGRAEKVQSGHKVEPSSRVVNPGGADGLGQQYSNHATDRDGVRVHPTPLYGGKGFEAPMDASRKVHPAGSQGRHK